MLTPRRPILAVIALVLVVAGCASGAAQPSAAGPSAPAEPTDSLRPSAPPRTLPPTGNTGSPYPELSVTTDGPGYVVELVDPTARAWRIVVAGTGFLAADRLELLVEIADIQAAVQVSTVIAGETVEISDLGGILSTPTSAAGGCHPTLQICYSSGGIGIDLETGSVGLILERLEAGSFTILGETATWPGEPFILGPWKATDPLTTAG